MAQLVDRGRDSGGSGETVSESMIAALHKYINEHRTGRRPMAEQPANGAGRGRGHSNASAGPQKGPGRPAAAAKAAAEPAQQAAPHGGRKRRKGQTEGTVPNDTGTDADGPQRKTRAKQPLKAKDGASPATAIEMQSDGSDAEAEDEAPAAKRAKGKKKPKPRPKGSAAHIGNVALGDGGSAALEREPSGAGALDCCTPAMSSGFTGAYGNQLMQPS